MIRDEIRMFMWGLSHSRDEWILKGMQCSKNFWKGRNKTWETEKEIKKVVKEKKKIKLEEKGRNKAMKKELSRNFLFAPLFFLSLLLSFFFLFFVKLSIFSDPPLRIVSRNHKRSFVILDFFKFFDCIYEL